MNAFRAKELLLDDFTVNPKFKGDQMFGFNEKGASIYFNTIKEIYFNFCQNIYLQQQITWNNKVYALYFGITGFDDMEWHVLAYDQKEWKDQKKIQKPRDNRIIFNYDEGPKNIENVKIFIKDNFLILERGKLYHSLYDLTNKKLLINEESPFHASDCDDKKMMNKWIKEKLHNPIVKKITPSQ